jgi:chaperonin cofactor prefoldin
MSGNEFKDLDIESKVNYVNTLLEQGNTVETICKNMGKGKNFIRNTLKDYGYSLNKSINQYIKDDTVVTDTTNVVKKSNKKVSKQSNVVNNINTSDDRIKVLEGQIKDLQKQINLINNRLDNNSITTNVVTDTTSIIHSSIDSYDRNDTKSSHYRIYTDIQEEFKAFCKEHKQYKVQDIISSAIKEYLDKYNK